MHRGGFLLRLTVGSVFVVHGTQRLFGWFGGSGPDGTGQFFESLGLQPGRPQALLAGTIEATGPDRAVPWDPPRPAFAREAGLMSALEHEGSRRATVRAIAPSRASRRVPLERVSQAPCGVPRCHHSECPAGTDVEPELFIEFDRVGVGPEHTQEGALVATMNAAGESSPASRRWGVGPPHRFHRQPGGPRRPSLLLRAREGERETVTHQPRSEPPDRRLPRTAIAHRSARHTPGYRGRRRQSTSSRAWIARIEQPCRRRGQLFGRALRACEDVAPTRWDSAIAQKRGVIRCSRRSR